MVNKAGGLWVVLHSFGWFGVWFHRREVSLATVVLAGSWLFV
ncbi:hypothetical protein MtrunA17_Chr5g0417361 [Medicago truncatula]|uniref:Transmembrane protein n=1 Tax=Medicago truncatula TaxID=3880 RepID=A0A396HPY9_MEDTR|nr:hypothetical protein MtrunA17_Chr5g0417361 [Medicago truncatula]